MSDVSRRNPRQPSFADPGRRRQWPGMVLDAVIAGVLMLMANIVDNSYIFNPAPWLPDQAPAPPSWMAWVYAVWSVTAWVVVVLRRRWPQAAGIALPALLLIHLVLLPTTYGAFVMMSFAMFHLGHYAPRKWRKPAWVAATLGTVLGVMGKGDAMIVESTAGGVVVVIALPILGFFWMAGTNYRRRDQELASLRDRAELAAIAERTRIAREMHDIVAHSLTAVIAQADGGRFIAAKHPEKAVAALENIAGTARDSLGQMRQLLSVLRDPADGGAGGVLDDGSGPSVPAGTRGRAAGAAAGAGPNAVTGAAAGSEGGAAARAADAAAEVAYAPMPGLDAVPQLIAEATRSGLAVTFSETGSRPAVGATTQLTIYRIVQESLTNAVKHAGRVAADVTIAWEKRDCVVTVRNDEGPLSHESGAGRGGGRGVTGMRERVALHGGTLDIDDAPGEFTVRATLPKG